MKNILMLFALTLCTLSYSQELHFKMPTKESKSFNFKNGMDKYVKVVFKNYLGEATPSDEVLRKITMTTMVKSKFKLKNKATFVPKKLTLMPPKNRPNATAMVEYFGKNSYGVESKSTSYFEFDKLGNITYLFSN